MANQHGGYRAPGNPAPVSGPGRLSRRTDGGPGQKMMVPDGLGYGQRQATSDQERGAAMSQADPTPQVDVAAAQPQAQSGGGYQGGAFDAPTARPNEPVTAGADAGPGPGPEVLPQEMQSPNAAQGTGAMTALLQRLSPTDTTGILAQLMQSAAARNA